MSAITLHTENLKYWTDHRMEYLRYQYDLTPEDLIIDLGAYRGEWSNEMYSRYKCRIVAVEPSEYIRDFDKGEIINKAVSTHNGKLQFGGRAYYASIFEPTDHEYECIDIKDIIEPYEEIAVLKCNVEGSEYSIMDRIIGLGLHKKIRNLQIQFHQIEGCPYGIWYNDIIKKLNETHCVTWKCEYVWENWERKQ